MTMISRCIICDSPLDAYGRDGVMCLACTIIEQRTRAMDSRPDLYELLAEEDIRRHAHINSALAPRPQLPMWEVGVMALAAAFIGFILVAL